MNRIFQFTFGFNVNIKQKKFSMYFGSHTCMNCLQNASTTDIEMICFTNLGCLLVCLMLYVCAHTCILE